MTHPPPTFADIAPIVIGNTDPMTLIRLRQVNHACHQLANDRLAILFQGLIDAHRNALGFPNNAFAIHNGILYRGDTRPPTQLFGLGFTKGNLNTPHIDGEKVKNVVSTSKDPDTVRRKYTERGGYLYALAGAPGLDTNDFNKLDEIATLFVPPECIIGAIGPIVGEDDDHFQLIVAQHQVILNPNCRLLAQTIDEAREVLLQLCHA